MLDTGTLEALTPYQQQLHDAHKARRAKWNVVARAVAKKCELSTPIVEPEPEPEPEVYGPPAPPPAMPIILSNFTPVKRCHVIQRVVSEKMGVGRRELIGPSRFKYFIWPRFVAMYLVHELSGLSGAHIGRLFGGRDHTCVLNALKKVRGRVERDPEFAAVVAGIRARFGDGE